MITLINTGIGGVRSALRILKTKGVPIRVTRTPPRDLRSRTGMEWLPVAEVAGDGTIWCYCATSGRAGTAHVAPAEVILCPDPLDRHNAIRGRRYDQRTWSMYVLPKTVYDDGHFFGPGEIESFLAGLDRDAARMGAPV